MIFGLSDLISNRQTICIWYLTGLSKSYALVNTWALYRPIENLEINFYE